MSILDRLKANDEDVIRKVDEFWLKQLNDDELQAEFLFARGQVTRLEDNMKSISAELEARKLSLNEGKDAEKSGNSDEIEPKTPILSDNILKTAGPVEARVAFVGASPSKLDMIREKPFSGNIGKILKEVYLKALGVDEKDALFINMVPVHTEKQPSKEEIENWATWYKSEMEFYRPQHVVALGRLVADSIDYDTFVPHPRALEVHGDSGEVGRKFSKVKDAVMVKTSAPVYEFTKTVTVTAKIIKTTEEKQIVLGVVMEPFELDTDDNWTNIEEIEKTAHGWMIKSQTMGLEHTFKTDEIVPVESFLAPQDMTIGEEFVKKGSWLMAVKVMDEKLWGMVKSGEFTGFSIGAKARIDPDSVKPD